MPSKLISGRSIASDLMRLTDEQLLAYAGMTPRLTPLENELFHRLEIYVATYGDMLGNKDQE